MKTLTKMFTLCCWSICCVALLFSDNTEEKLRLEQELQQKEEQPSIKVLDQKRMGQKEILVPEFDFNQSQKKSVTDLIEVSTEVSTEGIQESEIGESQEALDARALYESKMIQIQELH